MQTVHMTPELVLKFCERPIRPEDVQEWQDGLGQPPSPMILWLNFKDADYRKAILDDDGQPVVLFGCCERAPGEAWESLLGAHRPELVAYIHREMGHVEWPPILERYKVLRALSSEKQTVHHKWLERVGFKAIEKHPMNGHYFLLFERTAPDVL